MTTAPHKPAKPRVRDSFEALQVPEFRRFFAAALVSGTGSWLQGLATPFVMFQITDSAGWVGLSVFSLMLPMALVGPIAGPLSDRLSRRRILLITQSMLIVNAMVYATLWWSGVREPFAYVATGVVYGTINGFNMPAWQAYISDLVPRHLLMNAITLNSAQFNAARALGPLLGGLVLSTLGPGWSFAGNATSFVFVVVALVGLPVTVPELGADAHEPVLRQFKLGWQYARSMPGIMNIYIAVVILAACGGTLAQVHLVVFADEVFKVGSFWFGMLAAAFGVGAVLTTPWVTTAGLRYRKSTLMVGGLALYGVGELILSTAPIYAIGLVGVFIAGSAHLVSATTNNSTLQLLVDDHMRGRVLGMYLMVLTIVMPVAAVIQGVLVERFGSRPVVFTMGSIMLAGAILMQVSGRAATADPPEDRGPR